MLMPLPVPDDLELPHLGQPRERAGDPVRQHLDAATGRGGQLERVGAASDRRQGAGRGGRTDVGLGRPNWYLVERLAAVDEETATWCHRRCDAVQHLLARPRVATIKGTDPDCEGDVEGLFARL